MMRMKLSLSARRKNMGYWFVLPWIFGFLIFFAAPFIQTIYYTFCSVNAANGITTVYTGLSNYKQAMTSDAVFIPSLTESVLSMLTDTPIILVFSLLAAMLINKPFRGRWLVRLIFFITIIYGSGLMLKIQQDDAMFTALLRRIGSGDSETVSGAVMSGMEIKKMYYNLAAYLGNAGIAVTYVVDAVDRVIVIINRSGIQTLIFLAALKAIPGQMYEVGKVEGASALEMFWNITLPMLVPHIITTMVFTIVDSFTHVNNPIIEILQSTIFSKHEYGLGSAMSMIYFACILVILAAVGLIFIKFGDKETG